MVGRERSALWTTIYAYAMGRGGHTHLTSPLPLHYPSLPPLADLAKDPALTEDVVWNLRTWPLELVQWQTTNSHRLDITFNPEEDRYKSSLVPRLRKMSIHLCGLGARLV